MKNSKYCGLIGVVGLILRWVGWFSLMKTLRGGLGLDVKNPIWDGKKVYFELWVLSVMG